MFANSMDKSVHFYYLNLAPGETKHYTFFFDKHLFNPDMSYYFRLDYNRDHQFNTLFTLPTFCRYFASDPTNRSAESVVDAVKGITSNFGTTEREAYDMNGDGKVTIADIIFMVNTILQTK